MSGVSVFCERPDHPHASGENLVGNKPQLVLDGPSPREWGKPAIAGDCSQIGRTIPTRVGKTHLAVFGLESAPDHPHASGENLRADS